MVVFFRQDFGLALSKREGFPSADLHLPHEEEPDADQEDHGKQIDENLKEGSIAFLLRIDDDSFLSENFYHLRVFGYIGLECLAVHILPGDVSALSFHFSDLSVFHGNNEIRIVLIRNRLAGFGIKELEEEDQNDKNNSPENQILSNWTQRICLRWSSKTSHQQFQDRLNIFNDIKLT